MKVLFAIPALDRGGPDRVFFELLRVLDRTRFTPVLVTSEPAGHYLSRLPDDVERHHLGREVGVATRYPVSLSAPGVAFSTTVEVTRCQLTVDPTSGRFFRVTAKFFPYVE